MPHPSRFIFAGHLWTLQWKKGIFLGMSKGRNTEAQKSEVLQGTLDLMVLKVLDALGPQHGYGIARRIEQVSEQVLQLNEGTVYTSLLRLQQRKWIASEWGTSENNRKAKYYSITKSGRKQLARETENWERIAGVIGRLNHQSFESVAGFEGGDVNLTGADEPERLACEYVSASYFPTLGVNATVGHTFLPEEDSTPGTHPVVMIGYGLWQRRFGADPTIVGKSLSLNKNTFTVVGVLPAGFRGQSGTAEVWLPTMMIPQMTRPSRLGEVDNYWLGIIARLKPHVPLFQAEAEMEVVAGKVAAALPPPSQPPPGVRPQPTHAREIGIRLVGLKEARINPTLKKSFLILLAAVGLVLLIACVNTANLLLTRAVARRKEIAVRLALGASRWRLVRQFLTESVLLALLGGAAGLLVAVWGIELLTSFKLESAPGVWASYSDMLKFYAVRLDGQVLLFNLLLTLVTGFLFGLVPALQASRPDFNEALKEGTTSAPESFGRWRRLNARGVLVVVQIALSFVLLAGAGLMMRSLARLAAVNLGFKPQDITTLSVYARDARPEFYQQLRERVAALPGVEAASVGSRAPLLGYSSTVLMQVAGREPATPEGDSSVGLHSVSPEYFQTLRIPLIKGRAFTSADRAGTQRVALVNETTARKFWPGADPIGQRIRLSINLEPSDAWAEIVGIVGDVKYGRIEDAHHADVYFSSLQPTGSTATLIVRSKIDQAALVSAVRREVAALDRNIPVYGVRTMNERIAEVNGHAVHHFSARAVCQPRPDARGCRDLWRDGLCSLGALARDRHPHGVGRGADRRASAGGRARNDADRDWCGGGFGSGVSANPADDHFAV